MDDPNVAPTASDSLDQELAGAAVTETTPPEAAESAPVAAEIEDARVLELRNRLASYGRELTQEREARQQMQQLVTQQAQHVQNLQRQLGQLGQAVTQAEQQRRAAYLASLPQDKRTAEIVRFQQQDIARLQRMISDRQSPLPQRPQYTRADAEAYTQRRMREILDEVNTTLGLSGGREITGAEDELVDTTEAEFRASAIALARARAKQGVGENVTKKVETKAAASDPKALREEIKQEVLAELGAGRSNSAKAVAPKSGVSDDEFRKVHQEYNSRQGPKAQLDKLREIRERAYASLK